MLAVEIARSDRLIQSRIDLWGHRDRIAIRREVQGSGIERPEADEDWKTLPCDVGLVAGAPSYFFRNLLLRHKILGAAE